MAGNLATGLNVHIDKKYIWSSGELGMVRISKDFGADIELTIAQAKLLAQVIVERLADQ